MDKIIIAGKGWALPDDVRVVTFLDPKGYSFYHQTGSSFAPKVFINEDNESKPHVRPRRLPDGSRAGLGGQGWSQGDENGDPTSALRKVITTVVLHHDGGHSSPGCFRTLLNRGLSTHFMIDGDGTVYQAADVADQTSHAGEVNSMSVGIDLNNRAINLNKNPDAEANGRTPSEEHVINGGVFRSWNYTEEQYRSLIAVLDVLVKAVGIEPVFPVGEDGRILYYVLDSPPATQFRGIQCHWHSDAWKWDPGPGLDWERILAGLRREDATLPAIPDLDRVAVLLKGDRTLSQFSPDSWSTEKDARKVIAESWESEDQASRLCRVLCRAMEENSGGGYYPVGVNQTWHNGIHIPVTKGALVRPILSGDLVAAHLVKSEDFPSLGSNNFVLMRHRISLPPRFESREIESGDERGEKKKAIPSPENILTVFSLYMHLDGVDLASPPDTGLFNGIRAHSSRGDRSQKRPEGPMLETRPKEFDQIGALEAGYVGLFSPVGDEGSAVKLTPSDVLWRAGEFGPEDERRHLVHVEVFADSNFLNSMELGLYGKYLQLGPDEPESRDLVVRSWPTLSTFGDMDGSRGPIRTDKVLSRDNVIDFFKYKGNEEQERVKEHFRRLITRHVSEWSDGVQWVEALFAAQDEQKWKDKLQLSNVPWIFRKEVMDYLPYIWLTKDVSDRIGAKWNNGVFSFFHPIYFLLWWMYRRSAVRGKSLEQILAEVGGEDLSITRDVPEALDDLHDLFGDGEWEL